MVRFSAFRDEVQAFCEKHGLPEPRIMGVTKTVEPARIREAYGQGLRLFGENRVQEVRTKWAGLREELPDAELHLVGYLQRNKVRHALEGVDMIQSVDRPALVEELGKRLARMPARTPYPVLVEINTSGEARKHGVAPEEAFSLVEMILEQPVLRLEGLMTVGPYPVEEKRSRKAFALLREIRDRLEAKFGIALPILSMGMTEDWTYAVLEGSTLIRIGRAIFGERS